MTAAPYVLAKTMADAHRFAREELELPRGHYRIVTSPSTVKGIQGADLYLVPGWDQRYDRFAMRSALRWTRLNKIDVAEKQAEAPVVEVPVVEVPDGLEPTGVQLRLITDEEAQAFFGGDIDPVITEAASGIDIIAEQAEEPVVEEKPKRRRRSRCKGCGVLMEFGEESEHAQHLEEA